MNSSPLPVRPWTPPDTDIESMSHSDYFSDPFRASPVPADDLEDLWPLSPGVPSTPPKMSDCHDPPTPISQARPKPISSVTEPYTPTKASSLGDAHSQDGMPRYPYTPDSARTTRTYTYPSLSPLAPMPWDTDPQYPQSPVQDALFSCLSHLENLIQTRQPNADQMEYLISQFEAMASYLSAPEAQSRQSDDYLFSELELPSNTTGLGITTPNGAEVPNGEQNASVDSMMDSYVLEVGKYIEGVKKHTEDLTMRMDEQKQLNSIQLEIINDLRRELKEKQATMTQKPSTEQSPAKPKQEPDDSKDFVQGNGFLVAVGEALDAVGDMIYEW
ncbi:hypothetical protein BU26DRAFT_473278 [Trematosphaeria pertusa]|uniref:Uncharacterized protein n=1 Tax=Trematosphaeria pertusa TaxID=390896 RepID=A0A6A6J5N5_9PLEO|nr:uncharacterized protein BU26DRAFT_473278 [Trematosphaeria pertusa]KAF2256793.1 hypothetical protein BU26DRAFT_473278 [Trematosphaeria pertusa]